MVATTLKTQMRNKEVVDSGSVSARAIPTKITPVDWAEMIEQNPSLKEAIVNIVKEEIQNDNTND